MSQPDSATLLARMMELHPSEIDLSLDRTWRLLDALGNPHRKLPPVIHIAGTNGKGSTLAMIRAGLEAAGLRVHAYTSPHLVRFNERIVLAGEEISEDALCDALARTLQANAGQPVTYFEATTCAAFTAFANVPSDILLLEVGMGGRLDTTNVVDTPRLTIVTPVALDHQAFLGDRIEEIAGEKAGILKRCVPCIVARQDDAALEVIEARAARLGAPIIAQGQQWHSWEEHGRLVYQDESGLLDLPLPALPGPHQIENAGTALAALRQLGHGEAVCEAAVSRAQWPARMQRLAQGPLREIAPEADLWLDGGHNAHASAAIAATLEGLTKRPTHLVFSLLNNRDPRAFLAPLARHVESVTAVPIPNEPNAADPETLAEAANALGLPASTAESVESAIRSVASNAPQARILICGSLYQAGAVLRENG